MMEVTKNKYKIPEGLRPLLESLAREILRTQPSDLIDFSQLYFSELQDHRCSNNHADIINDPTLYERFRNSLHAKYRESLFTNKNDRLQDPMNMAATKIQAAFRGHVVMSSILSRLISYYKMIEYIRVKTQHF
ncbi:unnamed protein product [Dracunculus medinensis]|uniref:RIIa domain-containing protein n=1 Tax=Dracunculus medinensis TaxID=318479 RepID=A0A0N4U9D1_DRAME|nr:unnamed protein product [Dracunculus medinensis]